MFENFQDEHNCSKFCRFYELQPFRPAPSDGGSKPSSQHHLTSTVNSPIWPSRNNVSYHSEVAGLQEGGSGTQRSGKGKQRVGAPLFLPSSSTVPEVTVGRGNLNVEDENVEEV